MVTGITVEPALVWSGVALAAVGTIIAALHNVPVMLWNALLRSVTVSVDVRDQDLVKWVGTTAIERWGLSSRRTAALLRTRRDRSVVALEPARGKHLLRWRGRWVVVDRGKEESAGGSSGPDINRLLGIETISLRGIGRDPSWLRDMLAEAVEHGQSRFRERSPVRVMLGWGEWVDLDVCEPRALDTVILPGSAMEDLCNAIRLFLARPKWYADRGIPWRLGVGIYGPPGSGKGSMVRAVCGHFGLPLHMVDLTARNLTDGQLIQSLGSLGSRVGVLLDDLDATFLPDRDESRGGISLAGLLAAMDGPGAAEGRVLFVCSNRPERLDPALLRDGRIDITVELEAATREQARRLFQLWHPGDEVGAERFAHEGEGCAMAELQGRLRRGDRTLPTASSEDGIRLIGAAS